MLIEQQPGTWFLPRSEQPYNPPAGWWERRVLHFTAWRFRSSSSHPCSFRFFFTFFSMVLSLLFRLVPSTCSSLLTFSPSCTLSLYLARLLVLLPPTHTFSLKRSIPRCKWTPGWRQCGTKPCSHPRHEVVQYPKVTTFTQKGHLRSSLNRFFLPRFWAVIFLYLC